MSPYPTVVIVTAHQYIERGMESNGAAGPPMESLVSSDGLYSFPKFSA